MKKHKGGMEQGIIYAPYIIAQNIKTITMSGNTINAMIASRYSLSDEYARQLRVDQRNKKIRKILNNIK